MDAFLAAQIRPQACRRRKLPGPRGVGGTRCTNTYAALTPPIGSGGRTRWPPPIPSSLRSGGGGACGPPTCSATPSLSRVASLLRAQGRKVRVRFPRTRFTQTDDGRAPRVNGSHVVYGDVGAELQLAEARNLNTNAGRIATASGRGSHKMDEKAANSLRS